MENIENKYQTLFRGSPRILDVVRKLDTAGQIDLDGYGEPLVIDVRKEPTGKRIVIVRDGKQENLIVNTRDPINPIRSMSFDQADGFKRPAHVKATVIPEPKRDPRSERGMRGASVGRAYLDAMSEILG